MLIAQIKALLTKLGFDVSSKTDDEIKKLAAEAGLKEEQQQQQQQQQQSSIEPKHNADVINALKEQNAVLVGKLDEALGYITKLKDDSEKREQSLQAEAATKRQQEIKTLLDDAVKTGKIPADNKEKLEAWQKRFEKDFDLTKETLDEMPANKTLTGGKQSDNEGGKSSTFVSGSSYLPQTQLGAASNPKILDSVMNGLASQPNN